MSDAPPTPKGVIAYLTVAGGEAAVAFYAAAFDGQEIFRQLSDDGRLLHARIAVNDGILMLSDDYPEYNGGVSMAPVPGKPNGIILHMAVDDCDAAYAQALAAGATGTMPPSDQFWGERYARLRDPFGHDWSLGSPLA